MLKFVSSLLDLRLELLVQANLQKLVYDAYLSIDNLLRWYVATETDSIVPIKRVNVEVHVNLSFISKLINFESKVSELI